MSAKARPVSAQSTHSRTAWLDYGSARPDGPFDFGQDHGVRDDPDLSPTAMEDDSVYMSGDKNKTSTVATTSKNQSKSCFAKIGGGIRSLWATRQTEDVKGDRELHVKTTLRELIIYIVFLVILCIVTFGMTQTTMYYYTKVMSDLFLDKTHSGGGSFRTITSVEDFWKFSKGPLLNGLYWETWYNNQTMPTDQQGYIYYENKLLGVPRLRQLQVHSNSCVVHDDFKSVIPDCYESYAESLENKQPFGPGVLNTDNYTAWFYRSQDELDGSSHWGKIATYSGAGYIQDLTTNKSESSGIIDYLFDKRWIRRGTRVLFIDFTVYNANINLFCVIRLTVEFPPTGGAIPHATMRTVKLIRYVTVMDYFIMACEFILCLFILYYMVEEAIEIKKHKFSYFKSVWNILDILVIIIALVCVAFNVYRTLKVDELLKELLDKPDQYADFEFLSYGQTQFDNAIAIAVFLAWIKIFKYISFNKTMTQLSSTLGKCAKDLAGFAVMFFIIFLAFTQLGYLLFGTQVKDFSNFQNSFFTLFRIILGDFDFDQLEAANRVLGPIFFMLFVFFVFFVLINMFLAIINDTYSEVKGDMANQKNEFEMGDYFKRGYEKMLNKLNFKHDKIVDIQKALKSADINNDKQVDFDEWRQDLKTRGYADGEIEALFAKYDIDGDRVLDEDEQKKMQADLNDQRDALKKEYDELDKIDRPESARRSTSRVSFNDDSGDDSDDEDSHTKSSRSGPSQSVSYEEFTVLSRRVDRMEHSIGSIVSKIDAVLVKLEAMEKAKLKRRETMGKILDSITERKDAQPVKETDKSDGTSDEVKREQMERLVREELERWDSESSINPLPSGRGASPSSSGHGVARSRSRPTSGGNAQAQYEDNDISEDKQYEVTAEQDKPETLLIGEIPEPATRLDPTEHQALNGAQCENAEAQINNDGSLDPSVSMPTCNDHCPETLGPSPQIGPACQDPFSQTLNASLNEETSVNSKLECGNLVSSGEKIDIRPITPILPGIPSSTYSCITIDKEQELSLPKPCSESLGRVGVSDANPVTVTLDKTDGSNARLLPTKNSDGKYNSNASVPILSSKNLDRSNDSNERSSKLSDIIDDSKENLTRPSSKSSVKNSIITDSSDDSNEKSSRPSPKSSDRNDDANERSSRLSSKSSDRNDDSNERSSKPSSESSDRNDDPNKRSSRPSSKSSDKNNDLSKRPPRPLSKSSDRNGDLNERLSRPSSKSSDRNDDPNERLSRPSSKSSDRNGDSNERSSRPSSKSSDRNGDSNERSSRPSSKSSNRNGDLNERSLRPSSKSSDRNGELKERSSRPSSKSSYRHDDLNERLSRPSTGSSDRTDVSNEKLSRPSSKSSDRNGDLNERLSTPSFKISEGSNDSNEKLSGPTSESLDKNHDLNARSSRPASKSSDGNDDLNARLSRPSSKNTDRYNVSDARLSRPSSKSSDRSDNSNERLHRPSSKSSDRNHDLNERLHRPSSKSSDKNHDLNGRLSRPSSKSSDRNDDSCEGKSRPSSKNSDRCDDSKSRPSGETSDKNEGPIVKMSSRPSTKSSERSLKKDNDLRQKLCSLSSESVGNMEGNSMLSLSRPSSKYSRGDNGHNASSSASQNSSSTLKVDSGGLQGNDSSSSVTVSSPMSTDSSPTSLEVSLTNSTSSSFSLKNSNADSFDQCCNTMSKSKLSTFETLPKISSSHLLASQDSHHAPNTNEPDKLVSACKANTNAQLIEHVPGDYFSVVNEQKSELNQVIENSATKTKQKETVPADEYPRTVLTAKGQKVSRGTLSKVATKRVVSINNLTDKTKTPAGIKTQLKHQSSASNVNQFSGFLSKTENQSVENSPKVETQPVENALKKEKQAKSSVTSSDLSSNTPSRQHKKNDTSKSPSVTVSVNLPSDTPEIPKSENISSGQQKVNVDSKSGSTINLPAISIGPFNKGVKHDNHSVKGVPKISPSVDADSPSFTPGKRPAPPRPTLQGTSTDSVDALGQGKHKSESKTHEESAIFV